MVAADKNYDQFYFKEAHGLYIQAIEVFIDLMKKTLDDPNFQAYLKERLNYTMDRVKMKFNNFYRLRSAKTT